MCQSAWAPLRREMTDWQPGSRDRRSPEPVMWSAWQWVFTGRERRARSGRAQRGPGIPSLKPPPALRPRSPGLRLPAPSCGPTPSDPRSSTLTRIQQPQPQLLDQLGISLRCLQNRVDQNRLSGLSVPQKISIGAALGLKHLGSGAGTAESTESDFHSLQTQESRPQLDCLPKIPAQKLQTRFTPGVRSLGPLHITLSKPKNPNIHPSPNLGPHHPF